MISGGNPLGNSGNGLARWIPTISQWPVVVSLPGDASVQRPNAATGAGSGGSPASGLILPRPKPAQVGKPHRPQPREVAQRIAAGVTVGGGVGHFADAHAVEHDPDDAAEHFSTVARWGRRFAESAGRIHHISSHSNTLGLRPAMCGVDDRALSSSVAVAKPDHAGFENFCSFESIPYSESSLQELCGMVA